MATVRPFRRPVNYGAAFAEGLGKAFENVTGRWADSRVQAHQMRMLEEQRERMAAKEYEREKPGRVASILGSAGDYAAALGQYGIGEQDPLRVNVRKIQDDAREQSRITAERKAQKEAMDLALQMQNAGVRKQEADTAARERPLDRKSREGAPHRTEAARRETQLGYEMQDALDELNERLTGRGLPLASMEQFLGLHGNEKFRGIKPIKRPPRAGADSAFKTQERLDFRDQADARATIASAKRRIQELSVKSGGMLDPQDTLVIARQTAAALAFIGKPSDPAAVKAELGLE